MSQLIKMESGSSHFYDAEGRPCHQVENKSRAGEFRNTTWADAKKLGLYPSVNEVLKVLAKPSLDSWKMEQCILSALTLPREKDEDLDKFANRVVFDFKQESQKAASLGTTIHKAIEEYLQRKIKTLDASDYNFLYSWIDNNSFVGESEKRFCNIDLKVGGCLDFIGKVNNINTIVDFKSTSSQKITFYDSYIEQLCGYMIGLNCLDYQLMSVIISLRERKIETKVWTQEEIKDASEIFMSALKICWLRHK
jgi:hypothetical protein